MGVWQVFVSLCVLLVAIDAQPKNPSLKEVFAFIDEYHPNTALYAGLGNCNFPITSGSNEAQLYFDMGICMLHSFWPSEAIRAFRHVVALDETSAIAYWGLYQAFNWDYGYVLARQESLSLAQLYMLKASEREQLYIQAELPGNDWSATYQLLIGKYPWDLNAKSFWAWGVVSNTVNYMDAPLKGRAEVQAFLKNQTTFYPHDVGLQHYTIHAWEDTVNPYQAIGATELVASIAPNAGHVVHMPGHIYYLLGDHDTAHSSFLLAMAADERAMGNFSVNFQEYWEYIHNIAYMTGNLGEGGRHAEALKWATFLQALDVNPNQPLLLDWDPVYNRPAARYYFQGLVALPLLHFQYSDWAEAQTALTFIIKFLEPSIANTPTAWLLNYFDALRQYACVMEAYDFIDLPTASVCFTQLQTLFTQLDVYMNRSTENGFQVGARSYISLGVNVEEAEAVILAIDQKWDAALQALVAANASEAKIPYNEPPVYTRPILETYAGVLLRRANVTGNLTYIQQAVNIYGQILASPWHNNSGFGWFGVGYSYSLLGNVPAADFAFKEFLSVWETADKNLPQVIYATLYLNKTMEPNAYIVFTDASSASLITTLTITSFTLFCLSLFLAFRLRSLPRRYY